MWLAYCHLPCFAVNCAISFYVVGYCRDRLIGTCAYLLQRQENMRLLYVCAYYRYYYTVETWYLSNPSLSDEDAVYLIECCRRSTYPQEGTIPYCFRGPSTYMWRQKWWPFCCVPSGIGPPCLFVGLLVSRVVWKVVLLLVPFSWLTNTSWQRHAFNKRIS